GGTHDDLSSFPTRRSSDLLLEAVEGPHRPEVRPRLPESGLRDTKSQNRPGQTNPRLPGPIPNIRNIPAHNLGFTGRDGLLASVRSEEHTSELQSRFDLVCR